MNMFLLILILLQLLLISTYISDACYSQTKLGLSFAIFFTLLNVFFLIGNIITLTHDLL